VRIQIRALVELCPKQTNTIFNAVEQSVLEKIGKDWLLEQSGSENQSEDERSAKRDA
jgi:hypothetical protein